MFSVCADRGRDLGSEAAGVPTAVATDVPNGAAARGGAASRRAIGPAAASVGALSRPRARGAASVLPPPLRQSRRHLPPRMLARRIFLLFHVSAVGSPAAKMRWIFNENQGFLTIAEAPGSTGGVQ